MIRLLTILTAVLTLAACQLEETTSSEGGVSAPKVKSGGRSHLLVEQDCLAAGGQMVVGLAGPQCARPQPDAGKACSDSADCAGICLANTRSCSPVTPYFGCHQVLEGGKLAAICID
ncbi:hypothetical protein [Lentibacter sp. XHP0401]|uniref:hypothetical protein n=1 Tax=Lentibacter sp. XHP0401 TaxID=2984334 RepID=UPI0021E6DCAC|nr:hypothetical protein [Lentibacter sp. XHP0401]MCV2893017.1 hypothetical protein [Lentibacter sp. XHP0401]